MSGGNRTGDSSAKSPKGFETDGAGESSDKPEATRIHLKEGVESNGTNGVTMEEYLRRLSSLVSVFKVIEETPSRSVSLASLPWTVNRMDHPRNGRQPTESKWS